MAISEKKILSRLCNCDLSGRSLNTRSRAQKVRAQDIKRVVDMVDSWLKLGCVVIYAGGKVYAAKGGFRGEIDITKGTDRGAYAHCIAISNPWHPFPEVKRKYMEHSFRGDQYDAAIDGILNEIL